MQKALFSSISYEISKLLDNAHDNVCVAMAWFTSDDLFCKLLNCLKRNVKVSLILLDDAINWNPYAPDFNEFIKAGGDMKVAGSDIGFMHHKFCIIDNNTLVTGSYNWTYYAETRNLENVIITDNSDVVETYFDEFEVLNDKLSITTQTPRISWESVGESICRSENQLLRYEVKLIQKHKNLPSVELPKVFVEVSQITKNIETIKRVTPKAKNDIYIATESGKVPLINKGTNLPTTQTGKPFYCYSDARDNGLMFRLMKSLDNEQISVVFEKDLTKEEIFNSNTWELSATPVCTLNSNGDLHIELRCMENKKTLYLTYFDKSLVEDE